MCGWMNCFDISVSEGGAVPARPWSQALMLSKGRWLSASCLP